MRVEFGIHTNMDRFGGVEIEKLIPYAKSLGINTVGITDYKSVQSFPSISKEASKYSDFKVIYGVILEMLEGDEIFPIRVIVRNNVGLKNLYKLITLSKVDNYDEYNKEVILRSQLVDNSEGLLIGCNLNCGEIRASENLTDLDVQDIMLFYDFIEVSPLEVNDSEFEIKRLVKLAEKTRKIVIGVNDTYYLEKGDGRCHQVLSGCDDDKYFKTILELREDFQFLEDYFLIERLLVNNTELLSRLVGRVDIISETKSEIFPDCLQSIRDEVFDKINLLHEGSVKKSIIERVNKELKIICDNDNVESFYLMKKISDYVKGLGYEVLPRGNTQGSMLAYFLGFCGFYESVDSYVYSSLYKNIDACLEVPSVIYDDVINYLEDSFGSNKLVKAGVIQKYSIIRARQMIDRYLYKSDVQFDEKEKEEVINKLITVKRQMCKHVSSYFIIPEDEFMPMEYDSGGQKVTHFDYNDLNGHFIKLNLLCSDELSMLGELSKITKVRDIDKENKEVFKVLSLGKGLGSAELRVNDLVPIYKPKNFKELVKLFDVCYNYSYRDSLGLELVKEITSREELYETLLVLGLDSDSSYTMMRDVITGKFKDNSQYENILKEKNVSDKFLEFCKSGVYLSQRILSSIYAKNYVRLMYYKIKYPIEFYFVYVIINKQRIIYDEVTEIILKRRNGLTNELRVIMDAMDEGITFSKSSDGEVHMDKNKKIIYL